MKLINWDCLEYLKQIPDKSIDMILQDPPFNTTACAWEWDIMTKIDEFWQEWNRIIKPNGAIVMFWSEPFSSKLRLSNIKNYKYDWIWEKEKPSNPAIAKYQPLKYHEFIHIFWWKNYYPIMTKWNINHSVGKWIRAKDNESNANMKNVITRMDWLKYPKSVLKINRESKPIHPTQKPVALIEYLIKTYTNEWETVFDGFMGSWTCGVACRNLNRDFIWIELDENYFNIAKERIERA